MSSIIPIIRKRKRDGVTSVVDDEPVKAKHKRPRRGGHRKAKPQLNAEEQDSAIIEVQKDSKIDRPPIPPKEHLEVPETSDRKRKDSAKKTRKSKSKHDNPNSVTSLAERERDTDHPQEKKRKKKQKSENQPQIVQAESANRTREPRTETSEKQKHAVAVDPAWNVSQALGGRLVDADPIVTEDEK